MLTSNVGEAVAFIRTGPDEPAPDIELIFAPGPFIDHGMTPPSGHGLTIASILLQPESRGRISLNGREATIDPGYLTAEADLRRQVAGLRKAKELFATEALKPFAARRWTRTGGRRATRNSPAGSVSAARPSTIRSAPAGWASTRGRWSIPRCGCGDRRAPRRGRVDHAGHQPGAHARPGRDDRREGGRPDHGGPYRP
nr:hypothetical protein GCM10020093_045580 [Planobispora longispora]